MLRHQGPVLISSVSQGKVFEKVAQIPVRLQAIGLGRLYQGIQDSTCLCPLRVAGKQPVLPPHHKRPDGIFCRIIIRREETGIDIFYQAAPLSQGIGNCLAQQTFGRSLHCLLVEPDLELIQDGSRFLLSIMYPVYQTTP